MSSRSNNPLCESDNCFNVNELRLSPKDYSPTSVDVSFCFPSSKEHVKDLHNHLDIDSQSPLDKAAHERLGVSFNSRYCYTLSRLRSNQKGST